MNELGVCGAALLAGILDDLRIRLAGGVRRVERLVHGDDVILHVVGQKWNIPDFAFNGVMRMSHECDSLTGRVPRFGGRFKGRSSGCTAGQNQRETNYFAGGAGFFINKGFTYPAGNFLSGSGRTLR